MITPNVMYLCVTDSDVEQLGLQLTSALAKVDDWASKNKLILAPAKSSVTLFTPDSHQSRYHPQVMLQGHPIELDKKPRFLGVVFDTHYTFGPQIESLRTKGSKRLAVLKAVAGAEWGQDQDLLANTFKMFVRSSYSYAAGIWGPVVKPGLVERRLQPIQNAALRLVSGCHRMASSDHVHHETKVLPVLEHTEMLSAQFLASCLQNIHLSPRSQLLLVPDK